MPSTRRFLFPAHHHHHDRALTIASPTDIKDNDLETHASPVSSSSSSFPRTRYSSTFFLSLSLGLRLIVRMAMAVFLPKLSSRKRWQYQLCWSYWKRSLLRFFFFFLLGFLLGLTPFSDLDLDLESSLSSPNHPNHNKLFPHSGMSSSRRELGTILRPQSDGSWPTDISADLAGPASSKLLIVVTPTYNRALQSYYLHRLSQTLRLVPPPLLWIVVEMGFASDETATVLRRTGVMHRHLVCQKNSTEVKDRGVHQRNTALEHIERHRLDGIIYFADDDNIYSLQLFFELRGIRRFGTWPVAMLVQSKSKATLEGPICNGSQVIGWNTNEKSQRLRRFHVDMSGFAFNSTILWDPRTWHRPTLNAIRQLDTVKEGFQETTFIEQVVEDEIQMEGLPQGCSKIMNWHLHLEASSLVYPKRWQVSRSLDADIPLT